MSAFAGHLGIELKRVFRDKGSLLTYYFLPVGYFLLIGSLMTAIVPDYKAQNVVSSLIFAFMSICLWGLPNLILEARDTGVLRSFRINLIPKWAVLSAPGIAALINMIILSAIIIPVAIFGFSATAPQYWGFFAAGVALSILCFVSLGLLLSSIASSGRSAGGIGQLIVQPSIILSGAMVPVALMPSFFDTISRLLPARWAIMAMGPMVPGSSDYSLGLFCLALCSTMALVGSVVFFEWNTTHSKSPVVRGLYLAATLLIPGIICIAAQ